MLHQRLSIASFFENGNSFSRSFHWPTEKETNRADGVVDLVMNADDSSSSSKSRRVFLFASKIAQNRF